MLASEQGGEASRVRERGVNKSCELYSLSMTIRHLLNKKAPFEVYPRMMEAMRAAERGIRPRLPESLSLPISAADGLWSLMEKCGCTSDPAALTPLRWRLKWNSCTCSMMSRVSGDSDHVCICVTGMFMCYLVVCMYTLSLRLNT